MGIETGQIFMVAFHVFEKELILITVKRDY